MLLDRTEKERGKRRFFVPTDQLSESGFHIPVSEKRASEAVDYLKNGEKQSGFMGIERVETIETLRALAKKNTAFDYPKVIHIITDHQKQEANREMRQLFKCCLEGLIRELAFSLRLAVSQSSALVKAILQERIKLDDWILKTIDSIEE